MKNLILFLFVAGTLASCSPATQIEKTWMESGASVTRDPANKTLVIAMVKDETSRRVIEDELVKRFNATAVPSYQILTPELLKAANEETLTAQVSKGGFTHLLLMRLADVEKETSYVPGTTTAYYGRYGSYYGYGAGFYSTPGYYQTDKNYFIETTMYSVNPDKLLWTGTTKTVNPTKISQAVNEIADVITKKMKQEGFLK
jgi:hypothetical protein